MSISQEPIILEPKLFIFEPPADPNIPSSEVSIIIWGVCRKNAPL